MEAMVAPPFVEQPCQFPTPFATIECPLDLPGDVLCSVSKESCYGRYGFI